MVLDDLFVDLGLSVKWAKWNLGATSETDYGNYYAWGETNTKQNYSWETYTYCKGTDSTLTKYCNNSAKGYNGYSDNLTILEPIDDVANKTLGGNWRIPTKDEFAELTDTSKITTEIVMKNNIKGVEFTSLINNNKLFIPAAGSMSGSTLYSANEEFSIWTSTLNERLNMSGT